jgi:hypothetical protein
MTIIHIVLVGFKPEVDDATIKDVREPLYSTGHAVSPLTIIQICQRMLGLRERCIHPESKQPYIKVSSGGKNNSPERFQVQQHLSSFFF